MIEEITLKNVDQIQVIFEEHDPQINRIARKFK